MKDIKNMDNVDIVGLKIEDIESYLLYNDWKYISSNEAYSYAKTIGGRTYLVRLPKIDVVTSQDRHYSNVLLAISIIADCHNKSGDLVVNEIRTV